MKAWTTVEGRPFAGKNITGLRSGRLVAVRPEKIVVSGKLAKTHWYCECDCHGTTGWPGFAVVFISNLMTGHTRSCGCLFPEAIEKANVTHGGARKGKWEALFIVWRQIMARCYDPKNQSWPNYGGRGIYVDAAWHDYAIFRADMGPSYAKGLSIDRIDNDGPYSKSNTRWTTQKEQCRNRRTNHMVEINGVTKTLVEWCEIYGQRYGRVLARINVLKWDAKTALEAPSSWLKKHPKDCEVIDVAFG